MFAGALAGMAGGSFGVCRDEGAARSALHGTPLATKSRMDRGPKTKHLINFIKLE